MKSLDNTSNQNARPQALSVPLYRTVQGEVNSR